MNKPQTDKMERHFKELRGIVRASAHFDPDSRIYALIDSIENRLGDEIDCHDCDFTIRKAAEEENEQMLGELHEAIRYAVELARSTTPGNMCDEAVVERALAHVDPQEGPDG